MTDLIEIPRKMLCMVFTKNIHFLVSLRKTLPSSPANMIQGIGWISQIKRLSNASAGYKIEIEVLAVCLRANGPWLTHECLGVPPEIVVWI